MKILITGGCGFVGSNIAIFLKKKIKDVDIHSLDNLFRNGSKILILMSRIIKN
jgi:CDP-paratose 2-epimerase